MTDDDAKLELETESVVDSEGEAGTELPNFLKTVGANNNNVPTAIYTRRLNMPRLGRSSQIISPICVEYDTLIWKTGAAIVEHTRALCTRASPQIR